jgi:hypothetical protein
MTFPDLGNMTFYTPPAPGERELNLGDQWRGRWVDADELPDYAPVTYAYAVVCAGDKGYVTRLKGESVWSTLEGSTEGLASREFLKKAAMDQMGVTVGKSELIGYLECRATSHNPDYEPGAMTLRPLYIVSAKKVGDIPDGSAYQRRRLPMNEFGRALRGRYREIDDYVEKALDRYLILHAKGEM